MSQRNFSTLDLKRFQAYQQDDIRYFIERQRRRGFSYEAIIKEANEKFGQDLNWTLHPEEFANKLIPKWKRYKHQRMYGDIIKEAVDRAEADPDNIEHPIITAPPQTGKSFLIGKAVAPWYLNMFPERSVLYISHTHSLSEDYTWAARDFCLYNEEHLTFGVNQHTKKKSRWYTTEGGFMMCAGKGTAIPGRSGWLVIIDDLYSSEEEAYNPRQLEKVVKWFDTSVFSRMQQQTLFIIIMTRWNQNDLIGTLLDRQEKSPDAIRFKLYNFPALTTEENYKDDPLGRKVGESICPDRFTADQYRAKRASINPFHFEALWQGNPGSELGKMFGRKYFSYCKQDQHNFYLSDVRGELNWTIEKKRCIFFQVTDTNLKDGQHNDYHVTLTVAIGPNLELIFVDCYREHIEGADTFRVICEQRAKHSRTINGKSVSYIRKNFVEDMGAGTIAIQQSRKMKEGFELVPLKADKSKRIRGIPLQEQYQQFNVYHVVGGAWLSAFEDEIIAFTGEEGGKDDQEDCAAYAAIILLNRSEYGFGYDGIDTMHLNRMRGKEKELADGFLTRDQRARRLIDGQTEFEDDADTGDSFLFRGGNLE